MLYSLEQGPVEKTILEQCARQRLPLPERIKNAPELLMGLELYFTAFFDLTSCRSIGMGEGPIPWLAINMYCQANGIVGEQREDVLYQIQQLDQEYLTWRAAQKPGK